MEDKNYFNLDKPYRHALLALISVCTTCLGIIAWFLVKEVDINRDQTDIMSQTQKDIALIIQSNGFQEEKIIENKKNIDINKRDINDIKKKINF